eukprot:TRINITY_DN3146_c0_g1_i1.p1 TRINITY_DN3146_c0_g1~~TRINITY_DN3146_c0_g1_i1.p1  ORF type:complete len:178 (+),score=50.32 TRINITY_DN3146_c0_g1_i1:132-665(+)
MAEEEKKAKKKRNESETSQNQSRSKTSEKRKKYDGKVSLPEEDSEDDKESYRAEEQDASDSFDSDFFKPESEEGNEEFDMEEYIKFRQKDMQEEIEFGEAEDDPYSFLGFEHAATFIVDEVEYPSLAMYMLVSGFGKDRCKRYRGKMCAMWCCRLRIRQRQERLLKTLFSSCRTKKD